MLSLILTGSNKGAVVDLTCERPHIYTDGTNEYTISEFAELDSLQHELETKRKNIEKLSDEIRTIERYIYHEQT